MDWVSAFWDMGEADIKPETVPRSVWHAVTSETIVLRLFEDFFFFL